MGLRDLRYRTRDSASGGGIRKAGINALIVAVAVSIFMANMPDSRIEDLTADPVDTFVRATGLAQDWGVFAPDPRQITLEVSAEVEFADGSEVTWRLPDHGPFLGTFRRYRWRKWAEQVRLDRYEEELWLSTARWIARKYEAPGREVRRVTLVRRWYDTPPPGEPFGDPEWNRFEFFELQRPGVG